MGTTEWNALSELKNTIARFCQTHVLDMKDGQAWHKEANLWLARKGKLKRELEGLQDKLEDLPLPDMEKKNGKYVRKDYY
ncbi:hypothetical protein HRG_012833 [Hirsutella rhossiliensis]